MIIKPDCQYNFYSRFMEQIKLTHKTVSEVERDLNYPRNALKNYKYGVMPSGVRLVELSHYFGVTPEYLIGYEEHSRRESLNSFFESLTLLEKANIYLIAQRWTEQHLPAED